MSELTVYSVIAAMFLAGSYTIISGTYKPRHRVVSTNNKRRNVYLTMPDS